MDETLPWRERVLRCERMLEAEPHRLELRLRLAQIHAEHASVEAAQGHYRAAAEAYLHAGERRQARNVYAAAARAIGGDWELWARAADLALEEEQPEIALGYLHEGGETLLAAKMPQGALRLLRRAFSLEPFHPEVSLALGHALIGAGRRSEARLLWLRLGLARRRDDVVRRAHWALARHFLSPQSLWRVLF